MAKDKTIDLIVVSVLFLLFILPPWILRTTPPLLLNFFWFALPSAYLAIRKKKNLKKLLFGSFFIALLAWAMEFFLVHNKAWTPYISDFSFKILGPSIEELIWFFLHIFYILTFYEHFADDENKYKFSKNLKFFILISSATIAIVLFGIVFTPKIASIRFAYVTIGAFGMFPFFLYLIFYRPHFLKKILWVTVFFSIFALVMEVQAVRFNLWSFNDAENYLGIVRLFGAAFPVEEILFWMLLSAGTALTYYEIYVDDNA